MQDVVWQSGSISEKFIVSSVAEVVEYRQVRRAVAMTTGAIDDQVEALAIRCLGETTPWAICIHRSTVERKTCCRATVVSSPRVRSTRSAVCALDIANCWTCSVTVKSSAISTPNIFMLRLRVMPGSGSGSTACRRLCLRTLKNISHDLLKLSYSAAPSSECLQVPIGEIR